MSYNEEEYISRDEKRFREEYIGMPVTVSDELRLDGMHKRIRELEDRNGLLHHENSVLKDDNKNLRENIHKIFLENKELLAELDKIHSRFEILDL